MTQILTFLGLQEGFLPMCEPIRKPSVCIVQCC